MNPKKSVLILLRKWHDVAPEWGQSIYSVNCRTDVYLRYSKDQGNKFWFGVSESVFEKYCNRNFYILFICGNERNVIVLPSAEFGTLIEGVKATSNGEWHINIFKKEDRYELRVSKKGIFDVTPYLNYYDFTPLPFRKGYIPQVQGFTPLRRYKAQEVLEKEEKEELPTSFQEKLIKASKDSENPIEFEKLVKQAFQKLGFDAELIGGAGDTDILVSRPYNMIIDAKSTSRDSLSQIHFTRINNTSYHTMPSICLS